MSVGPAAAKLGAPEDGSAVPRWVPLVLALEWNEANPEAPPNRNGPDLLRELIRHLTGKQIAPVEPGSIMGSTRSADRET